jgi:hypothetical protein
MELHAMTLAVFSLATKRPVRVDPSPDGSPAKVVTDAILAGDLAPEDGAYVCETHNGFRLCDDLPPDHPVVWFRLSTKGVRHAARS